MSSSTEQSQQPEDDTPGIAQRFRGFLPVVVDVETGGFVSATDALLEIAAVIIRLDDDGYVRPGETIRYHVKPFPGASLDPASLEVTGIDPFHPLRPALEESDAVRRVFKNVRKEVKAQKCNRAILVGHNAFFDLQFLNAVVERTNIKRTPFHPFSSRPKQKLGGRKKVEGRLRLHEFGPAHVLVSSPNSPF